MNADRNQGWVNVDKPTGLSSAAAVARVKRLATAAAGGTGRVKVGHAGTLDPLASGVLVVMIGRATKSSAALMAAGKTYRAAVRLGATTATDDAEADPVPYPGASTPPPDRVAQVAQSFRGDIEQTPPAYSAIKVGGRRAYDLARGGVDVKLAARMVRLDDVRVIGYAWPDLTLEIDCGKGFYVRSLARDLGARLGCGGYLTALRRTRVGPFAVDAAVTLGQLEADGLAAHLLTLHVDGTLTPAG